MTRIAIALLLSAAAGFAQAPRIQFSDTAWDFGTRDQGSPGETKIVKVENVGVRDLRIRELDVTCGCVQPHFRGHKPKYFKGAQKLDISLGPGESIDLILDLHTERGEGEIKKFVTVKSNDPTQRVVNLPMTGTLKPRWWIAEKELLLGEIRHGAGFTRTFRVVVRPDTKLELESVDCFPGDQFETERRPFRDEETGQYGWDVTISMNEREAVGYFEGAILVVTDHEPFPRRMVRFTGSVVTSTQVKPGKLNFGTLEVGKPTVRTFAIEKVAGSGMRIVSVTCKDERIQTELIEKVAGKTYEVRVTLTPQAGDESIRGTLLVQLSEPGEVFHDVAYYGRVKQG